MLRLRSLGQTLIEAVDARLTPAAETVFATALYLIVEAGRRVEREELTRMLWPGVSEARAQHGLRQVLYRLKTLGAEIKADRSALILSPRFCATDFASMLEPQSTTSLEAIADTIGGSFLPGYRPELSEEFSTWVERQRDVVHSAVARALMAGMQAKKRQSDWNGAERLAGMCLTIDPLNEEATLTVAEAAALGGSKTKALSILNHYLEDIGENAGEIKLPAVLLRRRISEAYQDNVFPLRDVPFVGREEEMAELTGALARAQSGQGNAYVIWGEPGIGKTRLVSEFTRVASLQPVHIVRVACQSHDVRRPLSVFVELIPKMLVLPGALGCSPEAMRQLRRLVEVEDEVRHNGNTSRPSDVSFDQVREAILDLFDAIASERCTIVEIDDSQWLDEYSGYVLDSLARHSSKNRLLIIANLMSETPPDDARTSAARYNILHMRPLHFEACAALVTHSTSRRERVTPVFRDWCARSACGNPLFTLELAKHAVDDGALATPPSLTKLINARLSSLSPLSRRLLQVSCILGRHSSISAIEEVLSERRVLLYDSLDELASRGMVEYDGEQVTSSHAVITAAALDQCSAVTRAMLHRHAARAIEILTPRTVTNLWDCAEHWRQAGDSEHARSLLTECAALSLHRGLPLEAAIMFDSASELAKGESRCDLIRSSASAYLTAGDCMRAESQALRRMEVLKECSSSRQVQANGELFYLKIAASNNSYSPALVSRLLAIAGRVDALIPDRFEAVLTVMIAADNLCDRALAARAYAAFSEVDSFGSQSSAEREHCLIVYHTSFGEIDDAILAAERLLQYARESKNEIERPIYIEHAGHVYRASGDLEIAKRLYQEAFDYSIEHYVYYRVESAANSLLALALHIGKIEEASRWRAVIHQQIALSLRETPDVETLGNEIELLARSGQYEEARRMMQSLRPYVSKMASVHAKSRQLSLDAYLKLEMTGSLSKHECHELEAMCAQLDGAFHQDFLATQLFRGMISLKREQDATRILREYLRRRRSRAPLSADLRQIVSTATFQFSLP